MDLEGGGGGVRSFLRKFELTEFSYWSYRKQPLHLDPPPLSKQIPPLANKLSDKFLKLGFIKDCDQIGIKSFYYLAVHELLAWEQTKIKTCICCMTRFEHLWIIFSSLFKKLRENWRDCYIRQNSIIFHTCIHVKWNIIRWLHSPEKVIFF